MKISQLHLFYFSPTHTSQQVARAVASGMAGVQVVEHDLTHTAAEPQTLSSSDVALFVVPVYAGKVAPLAQERLAAVQGYDTPAIAIVVYGNRDYEGALCELDAWLRKSGFMTVGAGTFVGEHSYSTPRYPIAAKRPDRNDLEIAKRFGVQLRNKLLMEPMLSPSATVDVRRIPHVQSLLSRLRLVWKVIKMKRAKQQIPCAPTTDPSLCAGCGLCVTACPVEAIRAGDELHTDPDRCIRCCACVKVCRRGARSFDTPFAPILATCCKRQKTPEVLL